VDLDGNRHHVFGHLFEWMTLPFFLLGAWLGPILKLGGPPLSVFMFSLANTFYTALAVGVWCAAAFRVGARTRSVALLAVLVTFATPILFYAVSMWREPGILFLLGVAVLLYLRALDRPGDRVRSALFGVAMGAMFLFKEGDAVLVACLYVGAVMSLWRRERSLPIGFGFWVGLPIALALVMHGLVMNARFGTPFTSFYAPSLQIMDGDPVARLGRILASPEVGLVFYAPLVVLGALCIATLWRRRGALTLSLLVATLLFLILHAVTRNGEGGRFVWGPRHLIPLFPLFLLALVLAMERAGRGFRAVVWVLIAASMLLQLLPIVQPYFLYPGLREHAPPQVAEAMPSRIPGSLIVAKHVLSGDEPTYTGQEFGVDTDLTWDLSGDRVVAGGINIWWLRSDAPGIARVPGIMLALLAAVAWWWLIRRGFRS
jgi:hypothetical protein